MDTQNNLLLRLNFPFCAHQCAYCTQKSQPHTAQILHGYGEAMAKELAASAEEGENRTISAVSLEGGSPAYLPADTLQTVLRALKKHFPITETTQISVQTMPGEYSQALIRKLRDNGVNFWTVGLQTAILEEHLLLDRPYHYETITMVDAALKNFDLRALNFELLYGIPTQTPFTLNRTLEKALAYEPEHITLNPLRLLPGTKLYERCAAGEVTPCAPQAAEELYLTAKERLESLGYRQYTSRDFGRGDCKNQFRLGLLRGDDVLGAGYQAESCLEGLCYSNGHNFNEYLAYSDKLEVIANRVTQLDDTGLALRRAVSRLELLEAVTAEELGALLPPLQERNALEQTETGYRLSPLAIATSALANFL